MTDVVILGAGGCAREIYLVFLDDNADTKKWNVLGFVDDKPDLQGSVLCDVAVLGGFNWLEENRRKSFAVIVGVGNPHARKALSERAAELHLKFCTVIHPSVRMSRWVDIGPGTTISAGNILTTQVRVGAHTLVNLDCTISHDVSIGAHCNINPGCHISGSVQLGEGVDFGTGATIIQGKAVGDWSVIGAGSVVVTDIPSYVTAVGVPCRVIKEHSPAPSLAANL
jgi:sugar O-acyltransferase (sialic acid O-acetyltransferase NeuD family)